MTITSIYNLLRKLRVGETLTAKEKALHEQGLVSVLKKIHDDLDAAVEGAYGWPHDLTDEQILERLVALNAERAEEERRGVIRWLRPDYQRHVVKLPKGVTEVGLPCEASAKQGTVEAEQSTIDAVARADEATQKPSVAPPLPAAKKRPWPADDLPGQITAIRDLVQSTDAAWTSEAVAKSFVRGRRAWVEPVLESLAAVGVIIAYDGPDGRRWKAAGK